MSIPKVSIGLPVYNGETYLATAINSVLAQTFTDFELIISDNASTDSTQAICETFAAKDNRIKYYRSHKNLGAAWNFNRAFELATAPYFQWLAHDDLIAADTLAKCVTILDHHSDVVIAHPKAKIINEKGETIERYDFQLQTHSLHEETRFRDLLLGHRCFEIFGLIRRDILEKTPLMGNYGHGDGVLLARLGLHGRFHEIPEYLFSARKHPKQSMNIYGVYVNNLPDYHAYTTWFDPSKKGRLIFPQWRLLYEYSHMLWEVPLSLKQRMICYFYIAKWVRRTARPLLFDLIIATRQILGRQV